MDVERNQLAVEFEIRRKIHAPHRKQCVAIGPARDPFYDREKKRAKEFPSRACAISDFVYNRNGTRVLLVRVIRVLRSELPYNDAISSVE